LETLCGNESDSWWEIAVDLCQLLSQTFSCEGHDAAPPLLAFEIAGWLVVRSRDTCGFVDNGMARPGQVRSGQVRSGPVWSVVAVAAIEV